MGEERYRKLFDNIFGLDPNFQSESDNTKVWAFKAFVAAYEHDVVVEAADFVRMLNDKVVQLVGDCDLFFELRFGKRVVIVFANEVIWDLCEDGPLDLEDTREEVINRIRRLSVLYASFDKF